MKGEKEKAGLTIQCAKNLWRLPLPWKRAGLRASRRNQKYFFLLFYRSEKEKRVELSFLFLLLSYTLTPPSSKRRGRLPKQNLGTLLTLIALDTRETLT